MNTYAPLSTTLNEAYRQADELCSLIARCNRSSINLKIGNVLTDAEIKAIRLSLEAEFNVHVLTIKAVAERRT